MDEEIPTIEIEQLLALYPRIAITGEPRCGKTTISALVKDRLVIHTDPNDLKAEFGEEDDETDWGKSKEVMALAPAYIGQMCAGRERFVVEGVTVARALRKGTIAVDAVVVCTEPLVERSPGQETMGKGTMTILAEWRETNPNMPLFDGNALVPKLVTRFTQATLDAATIQRTQQGGIRVRARVTKVGVFDYNRDGVKVREYRPPDEVLDPESWSTLKGATVVIDHPYVEGGEVTPDNFQRLTIGHVEDPEPDPSDPTGGAIWCWLNINHAGAIRDIESGKLKEVSCGYENSFDSTPGKTPIGAPYDRIQRGIRYNHVALGPPGWGRQGADVSLSLDAQDNEVPHGTGDKNMDPKKAKKTTDADDKEKEKTADQDMPSGLTDEEVAALKSLAAMAPDIAKMVQAQAPAPVAPVAAPVAPVAAPTVDQQQPAAPVAAPVAPVPPKTMDAADVQNVVRETVKLHKEAAPVLGEGVDLDALSNREVRVAVIKTVDSAFSDKDRSDAEVTTAYGFAMKMHAERTANRSSLGEFRQLPTTDAADRPKTLEDRLYEHQRGQG